MSTAGPANMAGALELIDSGMRFLAGMHKADMPSEELAAGHRSRLPTLLLNHEALDAFP